MITGAHIQIASTNVSADRRFLAEVLKLASVDAGGGFMIYAGGPAEVAIHEGSENGAHRLYLMCNDIDVFTADMKTRSIAYTAPVNQGWGTLTEVTLPGGGSLHFYEPHHVRPRATEAPVVASPVRRAAKVKKRATAKPKRKAAAKKKAPARKARKNAKRGRR